MPHAPSHDPVPPQAPPVRCTVQVSARRVLVEGREVRLGGRAFDLLLALHAQHGQVVSKDALQDAVWPGLAVTPNNLDVQIWALRRCLGQDAIRTVARRGYALTAAVQITLLEAGPRSPEDPPSAAPASAPFQQEAQVLLPRLLQAGCLALVGGDGPTRQQLCAAVCERFTHEARGPVWHLQPAQDVPFDDVLRRLARVGGLLVLAEAAAAQRLHLYAWVRSVRVRRSALVLTTAQHAQAGVDADVHRIRVLSTRPGEDAVPARRLLRWQPRVPGPARIRPG